MTAQLQFLNKILSTQDYSLISQNNLTDDLFFNYKTEFNFIKNHYKKYNTIPDKLTFLNTFPEFDYFVINESTDYLLEQIYKDYNDSYIATCFNNIKKLLESGNSEAAKQCYLESVDGLKSSYIKPCIDLMSDRGRFDRYLEKVNNPEKRHLSTGFKELDEMIGGIDIENEDMVIAARTGVGKTWMLTAIAGAAVRQGRNVLFYSGEMTADKIGYRVDTFLGNIDNRTITRGLRDTDIELRYANYMESLKHKNWGKLFVITPNDIAGPPTVDALESIIETTTPKIDFVCIDQYSLLEDTSNARAAHERVANISKAIKNLQVKYRIPIISVAQMNRSKNEDGSQDSSQIGLSDRIGQDATCILMLSRDGEMGEILKLNIVKSRDGGDNKVLHYNVNFNSGIFNYIAENDSDNYEEIDKQNAEIKNKYTSPSPFANPGVFS